MQPQKGDKVVMVNGSGKKTHNYTKILEVKRQLENGVWRILDRYKVPMKITWDEDQWIQVL